VKKLEKELDVVLSDSGNLHIEVSLLKNKNKELFEDKKLMETSFKENN
jgi:hypothetical protein